MIYGLVAPGYEMAEVLAAHLAGEPRAFFGGDLSAKLKLMGVDVASFGDAFGATPDSRGVLYQDEHAGGVQTTDPQQGRQKAFWGVCSSATLPDITNCT